MELSVNRNLACVPYSWKVSYSLKRLAPCALDLASFLQHLDLLATRERQKMTNLANLAAGEDGKGVERFMVAILSQYTSEYSTHSSVV